jgi:hypothetical protein
MTFKVSQHYIQVVGQPDQSVGELRVRRMYADVLINTAYSPTTHNESVNSTLALVQTANGLIDIQTPSSTLNLVQTATAVRSFSVGASNTLNLVSLGGRTVTGSAINSISMAHLMTFFNYVEDRKPAGNVINLTQCVTSLSASPAESVMNITQNVVVQAPIKPNVVQWMALSHHTSTPHRAFVTTTLNLNDGTGVTKPVSASNTLNLVDEVPVGRVNQTINLTQLATFAFSHTVVSTLNLVDSHVLQATFVRSVNQDSGIGHALTWLEDTPCNRKQYSPFQGENTIVSELVPPKDNLQDPQGNTSARLSLQTPYLGIPTSQVYLRAPEMDNRDRNAYTRVNSETRGGELIVYSDPTWPKIRTLAVTVVGLTETQVNELQTFMNSTLGQEVGLTDWEGRLWKGYITNPNEAATQDGPQRWTVTFEFEGEMVDSELPGEDDGRGSVLNITQSVVGVIV